MFKVNAGTKVDWKKTGMLKKGGECTKAASPNNTHRHQTLQCLISSALQLRIFVFVWLAYSTYLALIENVWHNMKRRIRQEIP